MIDASQEWFFVIIPVLITAGIGILGFAIHQILKIKKKDPKNSTNNTQSQLTKAD